MAHATPRLNITSVPGFFAQDLPETDPFLFTHEKSNFGLLDSFNMDLFPATPSIIGLELVYGTPWDRFKDAITALNLDAPEGTSYRVLFLARHGQGHHNVAEASFGKASWEEHWARQDGDGNVVWFDSELTEVGIQEARYANAAWKLQLANGAPLPQSFYSSPLQRACRTLEITWGDIVLDKDDIPKPLIREKLRETLGIHTCDRRHSRSAIAAKFPSFRIEEGFTENDELFNPRVRETNEERRARLALALEEIFSTDESIYITISAHSAAIMSILSALGHRTFELKTGGILPVVVKVTTEQNI